MVNRSSIYNSSDNEITDSPQSKFSYHFTINHVIWKWYFRKDYQDPVLGLLMLYTIWSTRFIGQEEYHSPLEWSVMEFDPYEH